MIAAFGAVRAGRFAPSWSFHLGLMLMGWGIFNVVEGVIDHHVLGVHHVRDDLGAPLSWDVAFLVLGLLLIASGWALHRARARDAAPSRRQYARATSVRTGVEGYGTDMYQDYKPCEACGAEVRLRSEGTEGVRQPDGPVEERVCTNPGCPTNTRADPADTPPG